MSATRILLVEDELNFGSVLSQYLQLNAFDVTWAKNGKEAWSLIKTGKEYDCCVLDVMMPEMDGITLGKEIKQSNASLPFIFLTAKSMKNDVIEGFKTGADDYITKPFDSELLVYKLRALLQRKGSVEAQTEFRFGRCVFDSSRRTLNIAGESIHLSPKENGILIHLAQNVGQVVSREMIVTAIWGEDNYFNRRSMDVYMAKLRKSLKGDESVQLLSVHAGGYSLEVVS